MCYSCDCFILSGTQVIYFLQCLAILHINKIKMYGRIHVDSNDDDSRRQWTTDHWQNNTGLEPLTLGELTSSKHDVVKFGKECFSDGQVK